MLKSLEINGFKSFGNKSELTFNAPISAIVGPNGSGKSNAAEAFRFVLGEQSLKALRARNSDELLFNGGQEGVRRNRAHVKAVFDNTNGQLDIDYNEVVVERIVQRGDASTYRINGSQVRLKDVTDLLSDANIGTSRHHIISQGEADRVLNVHEKERKSMIEDALGLRRFYRRRREAIQKLDRTEDNLAQVSERRRDLLPELKFLKRQKKRIEKTKKLRKKLTQKYQRFFKRQDIIFEERADNLEGKLDELNEKKAELEEDIAEAKKTVSAIDKPESRENESSERIDEIKSELKKIEEKLGSTTEKHGEITGKLQALKKTQRRHEEREPRISIKNSLFVRHKKALDDLLEEADQVEGETKKAALFNKAMKAIRDFLNDVTESDSHSTQDHSEEIEELSGQQQKLKKKQEELKDKQKELRREREELQASQRKEENEQHEAEKKLVELEAAYENTSAELERTKEKKKDLEEAKEHLQDEKSEARILCGKKALDKESAELVNAEGETVSPDQLIETQSKQANREFNRQLERLKIKLENTRVSDQKEVLAEYDRVQSQVDFLESEIDDLKESKQSLLDLIDDIETTVAEKFDHGLESINTAFSEFFSTMFGGGDAELFITKHPKGKKANVENMDETPDEIERGVGINIKLPKKKVRGLGVLSGGERALVSIALLFALSQINPPPFVVLDEADAALDEANSRRFGNMIERLSERSQLIIITHNRETMSRADVLYGVTMDQSGSSRLLSLNFSEAVEAVEE